MSIHELQAALRALDEGKERLRLSIHGGGMSAAHAAIAAAHRDLEAAARRVAEGAGEPVAWHWPGGVWQDGEPSLTDKAQLKAAGVTPEFAYTTPPSADALVEALGKARAQFDCISRLTDDTEAAELADDAISAIDAAIAKHKENTR